MKKLTSALLAGLLLATSLSALAGPHGRGQERGHGAHFDRHYYNHGQHHRHHSHHGNALGWGVAGLALGSVLFSINTPAPAPVIVTPTPRPPGRMWYYCDSWQGYYPYVQYCPEGWRAVPAY